MAYLKSLWRSIAVFAVFSVIFATIFMLYHIPLYAVRDGALLCLFFGGVCLVVDAASFYRRHRELENLRREITLQVDHMPMPEGLLEEDYQELIRVLHQAAQQTRDAADSRYLDMVEYYTLWAHQIKTPIAAMNLLLREAQGPQTLELRGELQRIEQYVEMVLCYLRLDGDTTDFVLRRYDLDGILRPAVRKFAGQFIRKKIRLDYEPLGAMVLTDEKWLRFVVEQVLSNALKYTPAGGTISVTLEDPLTLCIADTGIGIAPEDLPRVFERGFTGYNGRREQRSSGIGLYLCRRILDRLGHTITIASVPGEGTTVRIGLDSRKMRVE